jgi:hypothetical protein
VSADVEVYGFTNVLDAGSEEAIIAVLEILNQTRTAIMAAP